MIFNINYNKIIMNMVVVHYDATPLPVTHRLVGINPFQNDSRLKEVLNKRWSQFEDQRANGLRGLQIPHNLHWPSIIPPYKSFFSPNRTILLLNKSLSPRLLFQTNVCPSPSAHPLEDLRGPARWARRDELPQQRCPPQPGFHVGWAVGGLGPGR